METRDLIKKILLCFEQSSTTIKYGKVYTFEDGPNNIRQITLSFGVTEYGNLKKLLKDYVSKNARYSKQFEPYLPKIGVKSLVNDETFINLLKESGRNDPVMQMVQERFYDSLYIEPALAWCEKNNLKENLSKLVICDSFLQSGSILSIIRNKFPESISDEKAWVKAYCKTRREWLKNHSRKILNNTTYRMDLMLSLINRNDWELKSSPIVANDVAIVNE